MSQDRNSTDVINSDSFEETGASFNIWTHGGEQGSFSKDRQIYVCYYHAIAF